MVENKLTFLTEVELPSYCFLSEAIEWIAFGRVPQIQHHSDGSSDEIVDYRFYWREMPENFTPNYEYPWFDRLEFESLGIPIAKEYFDAAEKCYFEGVRDLPRLIAENEAKEETYIQNEDGSRHYYYAELAKEARQKLGELGPLQSMVEQVEAQFKPHFDVACAKLFQLLVLGKIRCECLNIDRWERLYDEGEYQRAALFEEVPPTAFTLGMNWKQNEIQLAGIRHVAMRVSSQEILENRSILLQSGKPLSVERFGAFYSSTNAGRSNQRAKVGRRSVVDWDMLRSRLEGMARDGSLPQGKENCIYELIAFAESELGKSPSRTAVQRNLRQQLDAHYA